MPTRYFQMPTDNSLFFLQLFQYSSCTSLDDVLVCYSFLQTSQASIKIDSRGTLTGPATVTLSVMLKVYHVSWKRDPLWYVNVGVDPGRSIIIRNFC